ncbi:unnamed protein product, partial [Ectocarpus sp. 12 AP-2014]
MINSIIPCVCEETSNVTHTQTLIQLQSDKPISWKAHTYNKYMTGSTTSNPPNPTGPTEVTLVTMLSIVTSFNVQSTVIKMSPPKTVIMRRKSSARLYTNMSWARDFPAVRCTFEHLPYPRVVPMACY